MSDQPQPDLRWAPMPPRRTRRGRAWIVVTLVFLALLAAAVLVFFLIPRDSGPRPGSSTSPTPSPSATATATATPTPTIVPSEEPSGEPIETSPPPADPTIDAYREQVRGWLTDAVRGLDIVANAGGPDALPVVDTLQEDAQRLSDAPPPSAISEKWRNGLSTYSEKLSGLRSALSTESGVPAAVDAARAAVQNLRSLVGL